MFVTNTNKSDEYEVVYALFYWYPNHWPWMTLNGRCYSIVE